jgi:osmotically-inducible protein OsmY
VSDVVTVKEERIMKWNSKGRGAYSVVTAGALALGLTACDQIQSLWKSEEKPNPAVGAVAQPKPAEGTIQVARAVDLPKSIEAPKPAVDENKLLASKIKAALGADPALKVLAIDASVSDGAVTLYGTANNRALREKAAKVVSRVPGVKSVKNELVIVAGS